LKAVFGLGNPGLNYALTRHNVGFQVIDLYRRLNRLSGKGRIEDGGLVYRDADLLLVKPLSYMNHSGPVVKAILDRHGIPLSDTLIVHDELDLPLGGMKVRPSGGAGSHKGVRSVLAALRTADFPRLKIGIEVEGRTAPGSRFVLERFTEEEWERILPVLERAASAIDLFRGAGIEAVMARFNRAD